MPFGSRLALSYLALSGVVVGVWAFGAPTDFYAHFPGLGRTWVSIDGPFNEHLIRDTGAAYLMIGALSGLALWRSVVVRPFAVGLATFFFNLPHFGYHMTHLAMYAPVDQALNVLTLGLAVLCSAWLMTPWARFRG